MTLAAAGPELDALLDAIGRGGGGVGCPFAVEPAMVIVAGIGPGRPAALGPGAAAAGLGAGTGVSTGIIALGTGFAATGTETA